MFPKFGPVELLLILVLVIMLLGKMPESFGAVGKGIRDFRRNVSNADTTTTSAAKAESKDKKSGD